MRKLLSQAFCVLAVLLALSACAAPNVNFTKASEKVDLFQRIADNGGVPVSLSVERDGSGELVASFEDTATPIDEWVKDMNETALDRDRYRDGQRVVEVKNVKTKLGKLYATFYFASAAHLNNPGFDVMPLDYYLSENSVDNIRFCDRKGSAVSPLNLSLKDTVLVLSGYTDNMEIRVEGKIVAASSGMIPSEFKRSSIRYAEDSCVVIFSKSYTALYVVLGIAGFLLLAGLALLIAAKCGVFTRWKLKNSGKK